MKITEHLESKQKPYAIYSNYRSIANYIDGFKSSSRKLFYCKDDIKVFTKVDTIANRVADKTQYLHGSVNLEGVIKGLTSDYTGSNNIPLFDADGFFGTRTVPIPGASRYVKAKISNIVNYIYRQEDYDVLIPQEFEGHKIEPRFYVPIIPMILVNNTKGIGNGFGQTIYGRNPIDVIEYIINFLDNKEQNDILPFFNGYKGKIEKTENNNQYRTVGNIEIKNTSTIIITELPINTNYDKYITILTNLEDDKVIKDFNDMSFKNTIKIEVKVQREFTSKYTQDEIIKILKLERTITEDLTCIDEDNSIKIFKDIHDMINSFIKIRLEYYELRKTYILNKMKQDLKVLNNRHAFVRQINKGLIKITNKSKKEIEESLSDAMLDKIDNSFDYLLNMKIYSITKEKESELFNKIKESKEEISLYEKTDNKTIWKDELLELKDVLKIDKPKSKNVKKSLDSKTSIIDLF